MPAGPQRLTARGAAPSRGEEERNPGGGTEATRGHARSLAPPALGTTEHEDLVTDLQCGQGSGIAFAAVASIGVMREGPLHAAVKALLAEPGDRLEVPVGRFVIDLVRADGELVEVQTGGFGALGRKLDALLDEHRMRVVHPVAAERRIVRVDEQGQVLASRRSPKRATAISVFDKLVAFPSLLTHPNLTIEVLLLREDHIRRPQPTTTRGRTRDPGERRLVELLDRIELRTPGDIRAALPGLPLEPFSTRELAALLSCSTLLAQRTVYCLRMIGIVEPAGKRGHTPLHALSA
jgi:hypothetical protein